MKHSLLLSVGLCLFMAPLSASPSSAPSQAEPGAKALMLSVELDSVYNRHFKVRMPVTINKPFRIEAANGAVTNTISGTVSGPVQARYALPLYVSEWSSKTNNISGTEQLVLQLDKPHAGGPVSSFIFIRIVSLSKIA